MIASSSAKKYRPRGGKMKYPIAIELGGDDKAKEAIKLWIEFATYCNEEIPAPSELKTMQKRKEFKGMHWALVDPES